MHPRDDLPAGVPCWIDVSVPDPDAAAAFYAGLFGWTLEDVMPADAPGRYLMGRVDDQLVGAIGQKEDADPSPVAWLMYVRTDDADATAAAVTDAGGQVFAGPFDAGEAGRMAVFADPAGAYFAAWQPAGTKGVELVNAPGSWNFSDLVTPDLAAAEAFYGAVFGWDRSPFDPSDEGGAGYWRKPGYGDFLERINPGTRERNAGMGAPDRFEDAVATVVHGDAAAWGITFGVADADAAAAKATELGGTVAVAPHDAPWTRSVVLDDPQGARLTASQFVPPSG